MAERARDFRAAGIAGYHAVSAELVAAFLHRQEGAGARVSLRWGSRGRTWRWRACRYRVARSPFCGLVGAFRAGGDRPAGPTTMETAGARAMISLALGLRDAAGDRNHRRLARRVARFHQAADVRIDPFSAAFSRMWQVLRNDQIGLLALGRGGDAALAQQFRPCARHHRRSSGSRSF